jgi:hypothetical protein
MTGTNCDLFTHKSSRSYLNHLVYLASNPYVTVHILGLHSTKSAKVVENGYSWPQLIIRFL